MWPVAMVNRPQTKLDQVGAQLPAVRIPQIRGQGKPDFNQTVSQPVLSVVVHKVNP
jgi:hypothetical protein